MNKKQDDLSYILDQKEVEKLGLLMKIDQLEEELRLLEAKERKKSKRKGLRLLTITINLTYSFILCTLLICYISLFIDKLALSGIIQKLIYIIEIYVGTLSISILGAFIPPQIEKVIVKKMKNKHQEILKEIEEKTKELSLSKEKLIELEKEIEHIKQDDLEVTRTVSKTSTTEIHNYSSSQEIPKSKALKPYTKVKTKYNKHN